MRYKWILFTFILMTVSCKFNYDMKNYSNNPDTKLTFKNDESFKIMQVTDTHWSKFNFANKRAYDLICEIADLEEPDLAVISGDIIQDDGNEKIEVVLKIITNIFASRQIPWVFVMGNHDMSAIKMDNISALDFFENIEQMPYSMTKTGTIINDRAGNFTIPIYKDNKEKFICYILNSEYSGIIKEQVDWYKTESDKYTQNNGSPIPSLAFIHIPLREYQSKSESKDGLKTPENTKGDDNEKVCPSDINSGFYNALIQKKDIKAVFAGHDHTNSYKITTDDDILLAYGRCSKMYPVKVPGFKRGCRIINLNTKSGIETYIRLENGTKLKY